MAALVGAVLRRHSFRLPPGLIKRQQQQSQIIKSRLLKTYFVLLPETPTDTAEDNALLRTKDLPEFDDLTSEKCWNGIGKLVLEYESAVIALETKIQDEEPSFKSTMLELEKLVGPLKTSWAIVNTLYLCKNNEIDTTMYLKIHERAIKALSVTFSSQIILDACKDISIRETDMDEPQRRVLQKYVLENRLNGKELPLPKFHFLFAAFNKLESHKSMFKKKVAASEDRFSYRIGDPNIVRDFPDELLSFMSTNKSQYKQGPWKVTLHPGIYRLFMEHCAVTEIRRNIYRAYNLRASNQLEEGEYYNSVHIEEIRQCREDQAHTLGFDNYAHLSMETKMAGSVDNVLSFITTLFNKASPVQCEEMASLQEFAESRGFELELEAWDVPYWRRKQKRMLFNFDENEIRKYFPFKHVFERLLELCSELFGISFEEISSEGISMWHPDVRFFHVLDNNGKHLSSFYLDPYKRPGGKIYNPETPAWACWLHSRSDFVGTKPVAALVFNFNTPESEEKPSLLTFADVNLLFEKFGHALQHLLTTVPYMELCGSNIEWDATEVCSNFLQNWLYEPSVIERISHHYESGLPLSGSSIQDIIASHNHMSGFDFCSELYIAHLDILLYSRNDFWFPIYKELWKAYRPFVLDKYDFHVCSLTPIFAGNWHAAYYSGLWSRMVAADAFQAFRESDDLEETGARFRDTFFALGGGCHASEVFRRFRGRDPSPDALHALCGLNKHKP